MGSGAHPRTAGGGGRRVSVMSTDEFEVGPRLRAVRAPLPAYVPGRPPCASRPARCRTQAVLEREPLPAAAGGDRGGRASRRGDQPLPGHGLRRAVAALADRFGVPADAARRRHRLGRRALPAAPGVLRARRRGALRLAVVRGLPDRAPGLRRAVRSRCRSTAGARHDLDAMAAAVTDRTRLVFVCTPEQPHRDRRDAGPSSSAFLDRVPERRAGRARRGLPRVRPRRRVPDGARALPRAARTSSRCARSPRPTGWPGCGSATPWRASRSPLRVRATRAARSGSRTLAQAAAIASLAAEDELLARVEALVDERDRVAGGSARPGLGGARRAGQLRLARPRRAHRRLRRRLPEAGIVVRPFGGEGVRVTIGEAEANDRFLAVAATFPRRPGPRFPRGAGVRLRMTRKTPARSRARRRPRWVPAAISAPASEQQPAEEHRDHGLTYA